MWPAPYGTVRSLILSKSATSLLQYVHLQDILAQNADSALFQDVKGLSLSYKEMGPKLQVSVCLSFLYVS